MLVLGLIFCRKMMYSKKESGLSTVDSHNTGSMGNHEIIKFKGDRQTWEDFLVLHPKAVVH